MERPTWFKGVLLAATASTGEAEVVDDPCPRPTELTNFLEEKRAAGSGVAARMGHAALSSTVRQRCYFEIFEELRRLPLDAQRKFVIDLNSDLPNTEARFELYQQLVALPDAGVVGPSTVIERGEQLRSRLGAGTLQVNVRRPEPGDEALGVRRMGESLSGQCASARGVGLRAALFFLWDFYSQVTAARIEETINRFPVGDLNSWEVNSRFYFPLRDAVRFAVGEALLREAGAPLSAARQIVDLLSSGYVVIGERENTFDIVDTR